MTPEQITAMAREVGLLPDNSHPAPETRAMRQRSEAVQRFADMVADKAAARARDECKAACDTTYYQFIGPEFDEVRYGISVCKTAIDARSK